jgi:serine/threonine protein kinase
MVNTLKYCHDSNVMHRDLKPENIIILPNNQIKLIDFGVAKVFEEEVKDASTFTGTQSYMNPELIRGKWYSFANDI